ncbi:hypothetical protein E2C01_054817 [Portunus trituberculatus]|uniref:Uncharacterized protein n=1 Tax=Portunus trituberculatus TaxID=210409 RepID=A0A5B7GKU3_PORTR|nr:hypothetical protein [Portunus trituberculatus]
MEPKPRLCAPPNPADKAKVQKAKRMQYSYGDQQAWSADTIMCSVCMTWFHQDHKKLNKEELRDLGLIEVEYWCSRCCQKLYGNGYDYTKSLQRLSSIQLTELDSPACLTRLFTRNLKHEK